MTVIYVLLVAHFVGDFICQTDWMALNKSKRWDALALHVGVYTVVIGITAWVAVNWTGLGVGIVDIRTWKAGYVAIGSTYYVPTVATWLGVNAAAHFVQDAITSRINARLWFLRMTPLELPNGLLGRVTYEGGIAKPFLVADTGTRHWFFVAIGADQLLHYVTLFVTAGWWLQ